MRGKIVELSLILFYFPFSSTGAQPELLWSDEFNVDGRPSADWVFEQGFQRNEELQWYQPQNAWIENGCLVIEARRERKENPGYNPESRDWRRSRPWADYTSACLTTQGRQEFHYGRFEVRAKIPTARGSWPAIWLLGNQWEWPQNGEIDIMEYYIKNGQSFILANVCWGGHKRWTPVWRESVTPLSHFIEKDSLWTEQFHVWRMDWTPDSIRLYLDDELLNEVSLDETYNQGFGGNKENPFKTGMKGFGHYLLLNLAVGANGGVPDDAHFPLRYYIDYVRVYSLLR